MIIFGDKIKAVPTDEGVQRKLLSYGGSLMMTEVTFEKDAVGSIHSHPHEQVSYIIRGSFEFNLDGDVQIVSQGDSIYIPSGISHGVKALEEKSIIIDVFTPQREDFLEE
nr:cupin domain-containing protein [Lysinibacillus timonensis]